MQKETANFIGIVLHWWKVVNVNMPHKGYHRFDVYKKPGSWMSDEPELAFLDAIKTRLDWGIKHTLYLNSPSIAFLSSAISMCYQETCKLMARRTAWSNTDQSLAASIISVSSSFMSVKAEFASKTLFLWYSPRISMMIRTVVYQLLHYPSTLLSLLKIWTAWGRPHNLQCAAVFGYVDDCYAHSYESTEVHFLLRAPCFRVQNTRK